MTEKPATFDLNPLKKMLRDFPQQSEEKDLVDHWKDCFDKSIVSADELSTAHLPPREPIVGEWFKQGDLGFVFAPRGMGKTWLSMHLAAA